MATASVHSSQQSSPIKQEVQDFNELLRIAYDAVKIRPPLFLASILGLPWTWIPPFHRFSEFRIIDLWRLRRTFKYLFNVTVPSIPRTPPPFGPPFLNNFFWQPSVILQRPDHNGSYTSFPQEAWFFLNGIMTNDSVAQANAAYLAYLFHRPITLIQNSTGSMLYDLLHCALGKQWERTTEEVIKAFPPIYDALKSEKKRVVVIAHSQGTIIIARVLCLLAGITLRKEELPEAARELVPFAAPAEARYAGPEFIYPEQEELKLGDFELLAEDELAKLEIYCFATCANKLKYFRLPEDGLAPVPWIENFGNEFDIVARLGMLAPNPGQGRIEIDGPCYERPGAWGHLLNEHYLQDIEGHQKSGRKRGGMGTTAPYKLVNADAFGNDVAPRLFSYINGGIPAG